MLIQYTVKVTIINDINDESIVFNKAYEAEITGDNIYDNYHILFNNIYVLDLFKQEVKDYCETEYISEDNIIIDEYEIYTETEGVEVFFENSENPQEFTLTPNIKCYIGPAEKPIHVATLSGVAYDSNTIIWSWSEEDCEYNHYLISEPINPENEEDKQYIVATINAGEKRYIETNLEPNTAYSRRLINFSETQTALYSSEVTVTTECVNIESDIANFDEEKEYDFTITDEERQYINEKLEAFKSGVGDLDDLRVYKQMDKDFYEKFKAYFTIKGKYFVKEKRYDQVGFNYKVCLEGTQTINEQEGEVTFQLDAYPWQEVYKTEYLWTVVPIKIFAKVLAYVDLFRKDSDDKDVDETVHWKERKKIEIPPERHELEPKKHDEDPTEIVEEPIEVYIPAQTSKQKTLVLSIVIDLSSSMRFDINSRHESSPPQRLQYCKQGACQAIDALEQVKTNKQFKACQYNITTFSSGASTQTFSDASAAKSYINGLSYNPSGMTWWHSGLSSACGAANPSDQNVVGMIFFTDGFPNEGTGGSRTDNCINTVRNLMSTTVPATFGQRVYTIFCCNPTDRDYDYKKETTTSSMYPTEKEYNQEAYNIMAQHSIVNPPTALTTQAVVQAWVSAISALFGNTPQDTPEQHYWYFASDPDHHYSTRPQNKVTTVGQSLHYWYFEDEPDVHYSTKPANKVWWTFPGDDTKYPGETPPPNKIEYEFEDKEHTLDINIPWESVDYKTVYLESDPVNYTINPNTDKRIKIEFSETTKRAEFVEPLPDTQIPNSNVFNMLKSKLDVHPDYDHGNGTWGKCSQVKDPNGEWIGIVFKNVVVKDAYYFGDEDAVSASTMGDPIVFNSTYEYGNTGTINVYADIQHLDTDTWTDDEYDYAVVTKESYLYINGYSNAMIFDWTRYGHAIVNGYNRADVIMFARNDILTNLKNREMTSVAYNKTGATLAKITSSNIHKKDLSLKKGKFIQLVGNGIDQDMHATIDVKYSSPILNYRFDITDPDAFTPYHEILPDCDPKSEDKNVIVLTIYKANNITCDCSSVSPHDYRGIDFDSDRDGTAPDVYVYGADITINPDTKLEDYGHWITQYVHFYAWPMTKDIKYYDELPNDGEETMYGLVNGRYSERNVNGKKDLRVKLPNFVLPNNLHNDYKMYVVITEFYPSDALVSYTLEHEMPIGSGYTQYNGDYCTFSSDILIYKNIPHEDRIITVDSDYMELFDQEPYEIIQNLERPVFTYESELEIAYNYNQIPSQYIYDGVVSNNDRAIVFSDLIEIPFKNSNLEPFVYRGKYIVIIRGEKLVGDNITCLIDDKIIPINIEEQSYDYIQFRFSVNLDEVKECIIRITADEEDTQFKSISLQRTSGKYNNYYLDVTTNNDDVLAVKYPSEIFFDDNNLCDVPVSFLGVVNATSKWSPRIHNGYYYINQHEHYLHSEFDVKADFDETVRYEYAQETIFVSFTVNLTKEAAATENYSIVKNTKAQLLQDERNFTWDDDNGLTLRPAVEGMFYKHYEAKEWISPIVLFANPLTRITAPLKLTYVNTDGSTDGFDLYIRMFDVNECMWTDWEPFENNSIPRMLSCAYQLKTTLSATEIHTDYEDDDYWCCYLDWKDQLDLTLCQNIVIDTDHIMTGIYDTPGIAYSKIIEFACPSGIALDRFATSNKVVVNVAFSNKRDDLILENVAWHPMSAVNLNLEYLYYRFRVVVPVGEKLYWIHYSFRSKETTVYLPYIKSISMSGVFVPKENQYSFSKVESYTIPKDGLYHLIIPRIGDIIESDIANLKLGYTTSNISQIEIDWDQDRIQLNFDQGILNLNPSPSLLDGDMSAAVDEKTTLKITRLPYIFSKNKKIEIEGTPQQYSPITVEDVDGVPYKRLYGVNLSDMTLTEVYDVDVKEKYIELKRTDFEINTVKVYINDDLIDKNEYTIVNHLIIFNDYYEAGDIITITYNVENSFYANIDRENNKTTIYPYKNQEDYEKPDIYVENEEAIRKKYKVMFETNLQTNKFVDNNLSLNPTYRTDYDGFIYLTEDHNIPYKIKIWCNPKRIKSGGLDSVDLSVEVLDIIDNPVINKSVKLDNNVEGGGFIDCENYNTDMNGVIHAVYKSAFLPCTDHVTAKILLDDETTNIQESIDIINY